MSRKGTEMSNLNNSTTSTDHNDTNKKVLGFVLIDEQSEMPRFLFLDDEQYADYIDARDNYGFSWSLLGEAMSKRATNKR